MLVCLKCPFIIFEGGGGGGGVGVAGRKSINEYIDNVLQVTAMEIPCSYYIEMILPFLW